MLGKILIEEVKVVTSGQNTFMFDLSGYASGLYMVILNSSNSQQVFKVVKE
jgi:S-ribosylhomocysteine lyase LuxS involved in autoinducer biosynthesis